MPLLLFAKIRFNSDHKRKGISIQIEYSFTTKCDLHIHTNYSFANLPENTMERNIVSAIQKGIDVLCFTDHIELGSNNTF